ncbi:ABC transporter substrate-binding protein [Paenibacillus sp. GCM10012303]|uniref:ABC transporter substrate-binding protein n=1 Tax=Paenibacillus sp. GCM10012303 TaxID=3317340 RepID=UPI00361328D3
MGTWNKQALCAIGAAIALAGCSAKQADPQPGEIGGQPNGTEQQAAGGFIVDTTPVKLTLFFDMTFGPEDSQQNFILAPLKAKYPHITLDIIKRAKGSYLEDLMAQGRTPDIIYNWNGEMPSYADKELLFDLEPLAKTLRFDLGRFDPAPIEAIRATTGGMGLYGLPFESGGMATFYNKDLFDKFGVAYPKDGMTWDEMIEIAKKVSRTEDGKVYRGLSADVVDRMAMSLSQLPVDGRTNKASVQTDGWKRAFETAKTIWSLPNNAPDKLNDTGQRSFLVDKTLAMDPTNNILYTSAQYFHPKNGLNWDLVQYPSFTGQPNVSGALTPSVFLITKTSKHKESAMQLLDVVTSLEVQRKIVREQGRMTPLADKQLQQQLGQDVDYLKDKNMKAFLLSQPAQPKQYSPFNTSSNVILRKKFEEFFNGKDVNSALREAEEQINLDIAKQLSAIGK